MCNFQGWLNRVVLAVAGVLLFSGSSHGALYLSMDGIKSGSTNALIRIESIQWGVGRGISSASGGTGRREASLPSFSEVTLTKSLDSSSVQLAKGAAGGSEVKCFLIYVNAAGVQVYKLELEGVLISGYSFTAGEERPRESLSLNYTKITWSYQTVDGEGEPVGPPAKAGWDLSIQKVI